MLKRMLKRIVSFFPDRLYFFILRIVELSKINNKVHIENQGKIFIIKKVRGKGNRIKVGKNTIIYESHIRMIGNNNTIELGENVRIGKDCSFWVEGDNIVIKIASRTTFTQKVHLCAQENNTKIDIGEDCMFSNTIIVRTSDSHPIYHNGIRINPPKDVIIGKHVWIAPNSKIFKGSVIGDGCIIGSDTLVNKKYPSNVLIAGHPGKIIKENITWTREKLF